MKEKHTELTSSIRINDEKMALNLYRQDGRSIIEIRGQRGDLTATSLSFSEIEKLLEQSLSFIRRVK